MKNESKEDNIWWMLYSAQMEKKFYKKESTAEKAICDKKKTILKY